MTIEKALRQQGVSCKAKVMSLEVSLASINSFHKLTKKIVVWTTSLCKSESPRGVDPFCGTISLPTNFAHRAKIKK